MKIAVIGAGFTGLVAAYNLLKHGHDVAIFEKDEKPGGLAMGFGNKDWNWSLEKHYHHFFTNDKFALSLAREIGQNIIIKKPKTSVFVENRIYQLDSPISAITFPCLTITEKLRMAAVLGLIRYNPFWKPLEKITAHKFLYKTMGERSYRMLWEPMLVGKFGNFAKDISMSWFWARIKKRTTRLSYPEGGFLEMANKLAEKIKEKGGRVYFNTEVTDVIARNPAQRDDEAISIKVDCHASTKTFHFDKVIVTIPSFLFLKIAKDLPIDYQNKLKNLKSLGAINLVLRLKEPFLKNGTYWLNICDKNYPFLAVVEHTNFIDKKYYNNEHLVYIGNYLPIDHPHFKMTKEELLKIYTPYLKRINPNFSRGTGYCFAVELFSSPFAQPVIPANYSKFMPLHETPFKNVFLANIDQVYPWDRGVNYAVEMGKKIAKIIQKD